MRTGFGIEEGRADKGLFFDKFKNPLILTGALLPERPEVLRLDRDDKATQLLYKHISAGSHIRIHTDVDVDGVASCKILTDWLRFKYSYKNLSFRMNADKVHGISQAQVDEVNKDGVQLFIVLDSSCNETELIKQCRCDVLVIDHHKIQTAELEGVTQTGEFVVINYMSNDKHYSENSLSAGMEVYEFLRRIDEAEGLVGTASVLEDRALYQWGVTSLFTDVMNNDNLRNLYWIYRSFTMNYKEPALNSILSSLKRKDAMLSKSNISYSLAPSINRAIRAGEGLTALYYVLEKPERFDELDQYKAYQKSMIDCFEIGAYEFPSFIVKNISGSHVHPNYAGLIATQLLDKYNKTTAVFREDNGYLIGSFRGKSSHYDYCGEIERMGFWAQGHENAFGFRIPAQYMEAVMYKLCEFDNVPYKDYLGYSADLPSKYRVTDFKQFKDAGRLLELGVLNSYMSGDVNIVVPTNCLKFVKHNEKMTYFTYELDGIELGGFSPLSAGLSNIYVEYQDTLKLYVKDKWR